MKNKQKRFIRRSLENYKNSNPTINILRANLINSASEKCIKGLNKIILSSQTLNIRYTGKPEEQNR